MSSEVERIAELESEGFHESHKPCPECGVFLMSRVHEYILEGHGLIIEDQAECPSCGYCTVYHDAE